MTLFKKFIFRFYQKTIFIAQAFLPINEPKLIQGDDAINQLIAHLKDHSISQLLILTQGNLTQLPDFERIINPLSNASITYHIFDKTLSNPTIGQINEVAQLYQFQHANALLAIGGGSVIDLAKGIGAKIARPNKSLQAMKGILKVGRKIPPLYAIPTTAGTGSEATLACVVTDENTSHKYAINDPVLIPDVAVLLPSITVGLPKDLTATTGMDALTHAIEAYIGQSNTRKTKRYALSAMKRIFTYLPIAYAHPDHLQARHELLQAAYEAGVAFTNAYVGNVHAIAHALGGAYHIPHGLANAVILPHVLEYYNHRIEHKLSKITHYLGMGNELLSPHERSKAFIDTIKAMNQSFGIPTTFGSLIKERDLSLLIDRSYHEANPLYPVPVIFDRLDFHRIYSRLMD